MAEEILLEQIVVTPSRTEESVQGTTSAVTVFSNKDIEKSKQATIKELVKDTNGLDIIQLGSFSGPVSVFLRGSNAGHSQIMIDNIRVYDPIATNAAFNLAHLTLENIERIEVVRGPQSVLYGSDAVSGIINIISQKGSGRPRFSFLSEGGSYGFHRHSFNSQGQLKNLSYSLGIGSFAGNGISQFLGTTEKDPYENNSFSLRTDYELNAQTGLGIICRFNNALYEYDNNIGLKDDPDLRWKEEQLVLGNYIEYKANDRWKQKIQFSFMRNYRTDKNDKDSIYPQDYLRDWYLGENLQLDWQNVFMINSFDSLVFGFDWQREMGNYYYYTEYSGGSLENHFPKVFSNTKGLYLENIFNLNSRLRINSGVRIDDHSYAGTRAAYKIDASCLFKTNTKIKGGWGSAFKMPTLYQLHALADFWFGGGNPNLQPEEGETYEIGLEQNAYQDKLQFGITYFHTQLKNLIDAKYDPLTWYTEQYNNIAKARIFGYESNLTFSPSKMLKILVGYTWQDTEDKETKEELLRRPKNKLFLKIDFLPTKKLNLALKLNYTGSRNDSGNRLLKSHVKLDLNGNYKLNNNTSIFLKIENLNDEIYEEIKDYAQPRRSFFGGVTLSF